MIFEVVLLAVCFRLELLGNTFGVDSVEQRTLSN